MTITLRSLLLGSGAFFTASLGTIVVDVAPAAAQQQITLEEIVVTARKRDESLQDIPIAITAFTAAQLDAANLRDLSDIGSFTPGFDFKSGFAGGRIFETLRFRAMDVRGANPTNQNAALFLDGVYVLGGANSIPFDDVERIEVIKGPQSAYFGRNTFSGAVNYITKDPADEFGGRVSVDVATYGSYRVSLSADIPLIEDTLSARITLGSNQKGSMYTADDGGEIGKETTEFVSATLHFKPSENLSLKIKGYYSEDEDTAPAVALLSAKDALNAPSLSTCRGQDATVRTNAGVKNATHNFFCGTVPSLSDATAAYAAFGAGNVISINSALSSPNLAGVVNAGFPDVLKAGVFTENSLQDTLVNNAFGLPFIEGAPSLDHMGISREVMRLSAILDYEFDNGMALSANAAFNSADVIQLRDVDQTSDDVGYSVAPQLIEDYSGEIRLSSDQDQRLTWLVGANYYDQKVDANFGSGSATVFTTFGFFGSNFAFNSPAFVHTEGDRVETIGVFAGASYDITDTLELNVEGRYQTDDVTKFAGASPTSLSTASETFKSFTPRVILNWQPNEESTVYGTWARGSLQGVINPFFVPFIDNEAALQAADAALAPFGATVVVPEEELDNFEIGVKQTLMEGRLQYSIAAYYMDWKNQKFNSFVLLDQVTLDALGLGTNSALQSFSVPGSSELWGLEFETSFQASEQLRVDLSVNLAESKIKDGTLSAECNSYIFANGESCRTDQFALDVSGNTLPQFAKWSGALSSTYTDSLTGEWDWFARGDLIYTGKQYVDYENLVQTNAYLNVNLRAGVSRENLSIELYVSNLFDDDNWAYVSRVFDQRFTGVSASGALKVTASPTGNAGLNAAPQDRRQFGLKSIISF